MKRPEFLLLVFFACVNLSALAQNQKIHSKMLGNNPKEIEVNQTYSNSGEIFLFDKNINQVYGLAVDGLIKVSDPNNFRVNLVLIDEENNPHQIFETYQYLDSALVINLDDLAEETCILNGIRPYSIELEIENAELTVQNFKYATGVKAGWDIEALWNEEKQARDDEKIKNINDNLKSKGQHWVAAKTGVSEMSYAERKQMYGQSTFPAGFEYYAGGVISTTSSSGTTGLKSATASPYVDEWDWRNRHGENWITSVKNQGGCGSCWAFATAGATESLVNLYFNQQLDLDLSEQDLLSCSGAGDCSGGYPYIALDYITSNGIVDEGAFPYTKTEEACSNKSKSPTDLIKIGGRMNFGTAEFPRTEDLLKKWIIETGPVSGGLYNWSHAMTLVGYKVVKEGDYFYYCGLDLARKWYTVEPGDPSIGKTVWIFKNSWGPYFGDQGYIYVETPITNIGWTHALKTPVTSMVNSYDVVCEDRDGDGYYWWGLGEKPANCPDCPDLADGDDSDPTLGPLDEYGNCIPLSNPPIADFIAERTKIIQGESISFSSLSSSNTTTWYWTFEGGYPSTSTEKNPTIEYVNPGNLDVTLTVTNNSGTNTKTINDYIAVEKVYCNSHGNAAAEWINTIQLGIPIGSTSTGTIGYKDMSSAYTFPVTAGTNENIYLIPGFSSTEYEEYWNVWIDYNGDLDFDDEGELVISSTATQGMYSGSFHIPSGLNLITRMRVSMKRGSSPNPCEVFSNGEVKDYQLEINAPITQVPVADFVANKTNFKAENTVEFTDLSTNNPTSWSWTFEGGTPGTSNSQNPVIVYSVPGIYNVSLIATNSDGSDTKTIENYIIVNQPIYLPIANFTSDKNIVEAGSTVNFSDLSENNPETWFWEFENGSPATSTAQSSSVIYNTTGTHQVKLTVTNAAGTDTKTIDNFIEVIAQPDVIIVPVADFTVNATNIEVGKTVTFTDLSSNSPTSWEWTFENGDPATSTAQNPSVSYNTAGDYSVSLIVTNASGSDTKSATQIIHVEPIPAPVADFLADKTEITEGNAVNFSDKSLNTPSSWLWEFEGGNPSTSTEKNPRVTYSNPNSFKVSLTVTNAGGNNTKTIENYILVDQVQAEYCIPSPTASEEWISKVTIGDNVNESGSEGYADFTSTTFVLEAGTNPGIELVPGFNPRSKFEYWAVWIDFNSDYSFTNDEMVFSASKSKSTVNGTIAIPAGLEISTRMRVAMGKTPPTACDFVDFGEVEDYTLNIVPPQPKPPVADFAANKYTIYVGESIQFSDLSSNGPTSWTWSFPGANATSSTIQNPEIIYNSPGVFDVSLTVSKLGFEASTVTKNAIITVKELSDVSYCTPSEINSSLNYISKINIGSHFSVLSNGDGYSLNGTAVNLIPGQSYNVELFPSVLTSRNFWRIWIDFNNDGDFDDADETILSANNIKGNVMATIVLPTYVNGATRMRITMKTGKAPSACDVGFEGEVEDYEVSLGSASEGEKMASSSAASFDIEPQDYLSIYPNPTNNKVNLRLSHIGENDSYAVYSITGRKVIEKSILAPLSEIDLSGHPSGLYFVVINNQNNNYTEKIIKK